MIAEISAVTSIPSAVVVVLISMTVFLAVYLAGRSKESRRRLNPPKLFQPIRHKDTTYNTKDNIQKEPYQKKTVKHKHSDLPPLVSGQLKPVFRS